MITEDLELIQPGTLITSGVNAVIRRPRIIERQYSQWYLAPLFDCLFEVLDINPNSCGLLPSKQQNIGGPEEFHVQEEIENNPGIEL